MSVTNSYKTVTFDGNQCLSLMRALRERAAVLDVKFMQAKAVEEGTELQNYLAVQLSATLRTISQLEGTPFDTPRSEGLKP